jgi:hypothetical protein
MKLLRTVALSSALAIAPAGVYAALDTSGADWVATVAQNYTDAGPASESLAMVDFLLCVMKNSNSGDHVNETYGSMVDENICNGAKASLPAFASQVMTTTRTSNADPYTMKSWFLTNDGDRIVVDASIAAAPTDAAPRGVATLTWNMVDENGNGAYGEKGMLVLTDGSVDNLKYIQSSRNGYEDSSSTPTMLTTYIHGTLDGNGTSGKLRVQTQDYSVAINGSPTKPTPRVYDYVFNADNAHYQTDTTAICLDRSAATMTKRVYGYELFTEAGAKVEISGPFDFRYEDSSSNDQRGWADQWGAWLQGGEDDTTGKARPTKITRNSDDKDFAVCWDDDDDLNGGTSSCGTAGDDILYQLTPVSGGGAYTFADPISMVSANIKDTISNATVTAAAAWALKGSDTFATYRGGISTFDLPWMCIVNNIWVDEDGAGNCNGSRSWRQKYALEDKFEFTKQGTLTKYYAKAVDTKQTPAVTSASNCTTLDLSTAPPALASYTVPDITGTVIWGTAGVGVPSIANGGLTEALKMKVIHGVEQ